MLMAMAPRASAPKVEQSHRSLVSQRSRWGLRHIYGCNEPQAASRQNRDTVALGGEFQREERSPLLTTQSAENSRRKAKRCKRGGWVHYTTYFEKVFCFAEERA